MHFSNNNFKDPKDHPDLDEAGNEFHNPPKIHGSLVKRRKEEIKLLCTVVNYACGTEKLSENDNLGGNGEVFERSEGIFFPPFPMY